MTIRKFHKWNQKTWNLKYKKYSQCYMLLYIHEPSKCKSQHSVLDIKTNPMLNKNLQAKPTSSEQQIDITTIFLTEFSIA